MMHQHTMIGYILLILISIGLSGSLAFAASDCAQAKVHYDRALLDTDPNRALQRLEQASALCDRFHIWFVKGNAHAALEQWGEALEAYKHALDISIQPRSVEMAKANIALMRHRLGKTCAAMREFELLKERHNRRLPPWLRKPYAEFERSLLNAPMTADQMMCILNVDSLRASLKSIAIEEIPCPTLPMKILFDVNSDRIQANNDSMVETLSNALRLANEGAYKYLLVGHTDNRGSAAYNQDLSQRRATNLRAAILQRRPELEGKIYTQGKGESEPVADGHTERDHQINRRVEVQVLCHGD